MSAENIMATEAWNMQLQYNASKFEKSRQFLCAHMPYFHRPGHIYCAILAIYLAVLMTIIMTTNK